MLKKLIILIFVLAPVAMFAQDKFAYLNAQELFIKMPEYKEAQDKLQVKSKQMEKIAVEIQAEYEALLKKFEADPTEPTPAIVADRQKQVEQLQERYQNFMQSSKAEIEAEQEKMIAPIQEKLRKAIKEVGDENHYTYIVDSAVLLHTGAGAVDASKLVKTKLGIKD